METISLYNCCQNEDCVGPTPFRCIIGGMPADVTTQMNGISPQEIQDTLTLITQSGAFLRSKQLQRLLRFLIEETLAGRGERLKEYVLGVEVFGRPDSYDPRLDSIVRVEARRLRAALEQYYADEGAANPLIVDLVKGSYVPSFRRRSPDNSPHQSLPLKSLSSLAWLQKKWTRTAIAAAAILTVAAASSYWFARPSRVRLPLNAAIGVLPFENLSGDAENEFFCFGLMDEITTELAKTLGLRVVARTSAERFKRGDDIASIARQLKVDAVLEGSVRSSGGRVLVSAQLINAADSFHIWSEMYQRPSVDSIAAQDQIAQAIASAVRQYLGGNAGKTTRQVHYSSDPQANLLYWKGSYLRAPMGTTNWRTDLLKCADHYEQAVKIDERFAVAYAALADVYVSLAWERGGGPVTTDFMTRGKRAAMRALQLDNTLAEAHGALGAVQFFYEYDPASAEKSFQRALQSDPNYGRARMWYAYALVMQRRFDEAIFQARQAKELDPLSYVATTHLAVVNYFSHRYDEAMKLVHDTLEVVNTAPAHGLRGMILETQGKYAEAIAEYRAGLSLVQTHSYIKGMLGHAYGMSGRADEAKQLLKDANLEFEQGGLSDLKVAYIYLALGNRELAFQHLEREYEQRDPELPYINVDPVFDPIRTEPRFVAILAKMGLSQVK